MKTKTDEGPGSDGGRQGGLSENPLWRQSYEEVHVEWGHCPGRGWRLLQGGCSEVIGTETGG